MDFFPTILEIADLPLKPTQHQDGLSLVTLLRGERLLDREALYFHYPHYGNQGGFPGGGIRMDDWKLLERLEDGRVHLFNLKDDIGERNDLAEEHPDRAPQCETSCTTGIEKSMRSFCGPRKEELNRGDRSGSR